MAGPSNASAAPALTKLKQRWPSATPCAGSPVRASPRGGRISTAVLRDATHWDKVVCDLGYEHLRRHDLRHTGLTWMADAGVPVRVLQKIAGHGSFTTAPHPDRKKYEEAEAALGAHLTGPPLVPRDQQTR